MCCIDDMFISLANVHETENLQIFKWIVCPHRPPTRDPHSGGWWWSPHTPPYHRPSEGNIHRPWFGGGADGRWSRRPSGVWAALWWKMWGSGAGRHPPAEPCDTAGCRGLRGDPFWDQHHHQQSLCACLRYRPLQLTVFLLIQGLAASCFSLENYGCCYLLIVTSSTLLKPHFSTQSTISTVSSHQPWCLLWCCRFNKWHLILM